MNILVTANCFPPHMGGTEMYSFELASGLAKLPATRVVVIAPEVEGCKTWDASSPLEIIRYGSALSRLFLFFKILLTHKIDKIYITHRAHFLTLAVWAHNVLKIPFWITLHGTEYFGQDKARSIARKLEKAQRVIVTSSFVHQKAVSEGVPPGKLTLIPPSLDTDRFHPDIDPAPLRKKYNLNGKKVLVTLCRLVPQKAVDGVIKALADFRDDLPPLHFFILGTGEDEARLKALTSEKSLTDCVTFVGEIPNQQLTEPDGAYLHLADVFILTSAGEAFGICYLEAAACGKPVIACRSGGVVEVVEHLKTGLLVPPGNVQEIGRALKHLLDNPEQAKHLGAEGRAKVLREFSRSAAIHRIGNLMKLNEI
jgi:phosphatidylinositol alpha-1,6-mannosyltransferase